MTAHVQPWLPETALADRRLVESLDAVVRDWSSQWFGDSGPQRLERARTLSHMDVSGASEEWRNFAPGTWLAWNERTAIALARQALALGDVRPRMGAADQRLLHRYAEGIARALAQGLSARIDPPSERPNPGRGLELTLHFAGPGGTLRLVVEHAALVRLRKRLCRPREPEEHEASLLSAALAASPVRIEASLGKAQVAALDLHDLAVGDVLVLDRRQDQPLLLLAPDAGTVVGGARLVRKDDGFILTAC